MVLLLSSGCIQFYLFTIYFNCGYPGNHFKWSFKYRTLSLSISNHSLPVALKKVN